MKYNSIFPQKRTVHMYTSIKINMKKFDLDSAVLGRGSGRFQVSSLRFFMCTPCLYGLKDSPGRLKKRNKKYM